MIEQIIADRLQDITCEGFFFTGLQKNLSDWTPKDHY